MAKDQEWGNRNEINKSPGIELTMGRGERERKKEEREREEERKKERKKERKRERERGKMGENGSYPWGRV